MIEEAALNNAAWCDALCRAHGLPGAFAPRAWTNPRRTPPYYPDAVTLSPEATDADILPFIDDTTGASVKDSFAALTLPGFELLFAATWLHAGPDAPQGAARDIRWRVVRDAETLRAWEEAWGGQGGLFTVALLADPSVKLLWAEDGSASGFVLNETPGGRTVGVSNVFGDDAWPHVRTQAAALFPGRDLVGYEIDPAPAAEHGFTPLGPLRVWLKN